MSSSRAEQRPQDLHLGLDMKTTDTDLTGAGATAPKTLTDEQRGPLALDPLSPTVPSPSESEQATRRADPLSLTPLSPIFTTR